METPSPKASKPTYNELFLDMMKAADSMAVLIAIFEPLIPKPKGGKEPSNAQVLASLAKSMPHLRKGIPLIIEEVKKLDPIYDKYKPFAEAFKLHKQHVNADAGN